MNVEVPPFDNVEVRRAVACAIDREHLSLVKPTNMSANGRPFPPKFPGVDVIAGQHYDYDAALAHMARAGFPYDPKTGKGGYPEVIPYIVYRQGLHEYTSQVLAQELAKIGLRIEVQLLNYPAYLAVTHRRKGAGISPQGWQQEYPDPSNFLDPLYHSRAIAEEDSNNSSFYTNPTVDKLLDEARRELVPAKRRQLYADAERVIINDAPWAFTFSYRWYEVRQPALKGYKAHPIWIADVRSAWLDRPGAASTAMQRVFGPSALASLTGAFR